MRNFTFAAEMIKIVLSDSDISIFCCTFKVRTEIVQNKIVFWIQEYAEILQWLLSLPKKRLLRQKYDNHITLSEFLVSSFALN